MFSDCSCDWQMGKKKGRVQKHATRAKSAREGSDAEESESGDLSGTSSEKQRLFDTRAELREAKAGCAAKGEPKVEEGADHALHLPPFTSISPSPSTCKNL